MVADEAAPTGFWLVPVCWAAEIWGKKGGKKGNPLSVALTVKDDVVEVCVTLKNVQKK